jgi:imidazole glycerol-phosphate synthase subunit HisF
MLKTRIIPTLLWSEKTLVKGKQFDAWRTVTTPLPAIKVYNLRQVDELIIVDITATKEQRVPDYSSVRDFSRECFMPLTVGGGITEVDHIRHLLLAGADKVAINSALFSHIDLVSRGADKFGSQCIVASIDAMKDGDRHVCYSHCGTRSTDIEVQDWAMQLEKAGAGEILLTSIRDDGMMHGYDLELIQKVAAVVSIPLIVQGGCGNYEHMFDAIKAGAQAVSAASIFHFTQQTPMEAKKYLHDKGVKVRL